MRFDEMYHCPIIDGHIHYAHPKLLNDLVAVKDLAGFDRMNIVCTPDQNRLSLIPDAMHLKAQFPGNVFVFGGLDISAYFRETQRVGQVFAESIQFLQMLGCDGIKMIEGKPQMRRILPVPPFDSEVFAPFWERMAATQFPLLMHVNDPEEFWDKDRAPKWAFERGWFYGDGSFINNEKQYTELLGVLKTNPTLKVIFAHFFFLSAQLPRLAEILDQYPNVCVDLTPGIEMYRNFSNNLQATRDFFIKYQDRILFGTDIGARALLANLDDGIQTGESLERVYLVRNFLENEGKFSLDPQKGFLFDQNDASYQGLALPLEVLDKIYFKNFERLVSKNPRPVNPGMMVEFCNQLEKLIEIQGSSQPGVPGDTSVVKTVRDYFMNSTKTIR
jgi:predicted TIM-barrel fold metal-dependent hydrolase